MTECIIRPWQRVAPCPDWSPGCHAPPKTTFNRGFNVSKRLTTEEFIIKAKSVHGDRYDYSLCKYSSSTQKILIKCHYHGEFLQAPAQHLRGKGCYKCRGRSIAKKLSATNDHFVVKANKIHCYRYDYSKCTYINSHTNVIITCRIHGDFKQMPYKHLEGHGCKTCAYEKISIGKVGSNDFFISRCLGVHGDRYDYSMVEYVGADASVCIICKKHGAFSQRAVSHMRGKGCPKCGIEDRVSRRTMATEEFIRRSNDIHGHRYNYDEIEYKNIMTKVKIICDKHGCFYQSPNIHLKGSGCPSCANSGGYSQCVNGYLYSIISSCGSMIKVGISNNYKKRIETLRRCTPFDFSLISVSEGHGALIMRKERYYHRKYESAGLSGFDGATEWLKYSPELMSEIMNEAP